MNRNSLGHFKPRQFDGERRRLTPQQRAECRAELARLSARVKQTAESVGQRMQQQAAQAVAAEKVDVMERHNRRMELWRQRAGEGN